MPLSNKKKREIIDAMSWEQLLNCLMPCDRGRRWAATVFENPKFTMQDVWDRCESYDDLRWFIGCVMTDKEDRAFDAYMEVLCPDLYDLALDDAARVFKNGIKSYGFSIDYALIREVQRRMSVEDPKEILAALGSGQAVYVGRAWDDKHEEYKTGLSVHQTAFRYSQQL